jgi:hypothetical protein
MKAKRRLANEYNAVQQRGEVQTQGGDQVSNLPERKDTPAVADLGPPYRRWLTVM